MLVSIIIPAYNAEKYIKKAVDSALNQTYKKIEIIVYDDGSTDDTYSELLDYGKDKIVRRCSMHNRGIAVALNFAIKHSKGDFIKWLSADDVLEPDAIQMMLLQIQKLEQNGFDIKNAIFYTHYHIIDSDGCWIKDFVEPDPPPDLWKKFYGNGSSSLIHRNVFEKCGLFDESYRFGEDYEFWLRATQLYGVKLKLLPIFTVNYRRHPEQLTNKVGGGNDARIKASIRERLATKQHN